MTMAHLPIQNSEVYVLNSPSRPISASPPPSPPTPCETESLSPIPSSLTPITTTSLPKSSDASLSSRLSSATHVLSTEATALSHLTTLYNTSPTARDGFNRAIAAICHCISERGKLVISGVGKSGHIAKKLVATMNSLQIHSTFLHPTEALHGDLGKVSPFDVILLITFSGKTQELLELIPHFDDKLPILVMTSHVKREDCVITKRWPRAVLLPAPIHESETVSFGVSAPTTSTTVALALGDALAVTTSNELHASVSEVFSRNHPGGAIGDAFKSTGGEKSKSMGEEKGKRKVKDVMVARDCVPQIEATGDGVTCANVLMMHCQSLKSEAKGWVALKGMGVVSPGRMERLKVEQLGCRIYEVEGLVVPEDDCLRLNGDLDVSTVAEWARANRRKAGGWPDDMILTVGEGDDVKGLVEVSDLLDAKL